MRIVVAPDKFKGCLSAAQVCAAIAAGLRAADADVEIDQIPLADGGEGFTQAMVNAAGGQFHHRRVTSPLPERKVNATFAVLADGMTAVIEMSAASGLALLAPGERNPLATTTFGTGELIVAAIEMGARRILLGIGGSATIDAGIGAAQACGHTIVLADGEPISATEPLVGADLDRIVMVKRHRGEKTDGIDITVACDVNNPLYGPTGAARVFGAQKGATPTQIDQLDAAMHQLASRLGKDDLAALPGAGAAGGLGFGMMAYFGACLAPGIDLVIQAAHLRERLTGADICITGEGRLDRSTSHGKVVCGVGAMCAELGVPCIALVGAMDEAAASEPPSGVIPLCICPRPMSQDEAMREADVNLRQMAARVIALMKTFR